MGEVRSFAGASFVPVAVGRSGSGFFVGVSRTGIVGDMVVTPEGEAGGGVSGGATGVVDSQAAMKKVRTSRQCRAFVVIDIQYLADEIERVLRVGIAGSVIERLFPGSTRALDVALAVQPPAVP